MTANANVTSDHLERWATDRDGPVALHMAQELLPVEGRGAVLFPPTYANVGYSIDTLQDGRRVALIDSVGAQANRIEPVFLDERNRHLVPQISIAYGDGDMAGELSLLEAGHRLGDAIVRSTELHDSARQAFLALVRQGNATPLAKLAPTSLLFGVWDSRDTMAKVPRLLQAVIRAWDVSELKRSAQYNPALDYAALEVFSEAEKEKAEGKSSSPLAERGFVHVPSGTTHGGIVAEGPIRRDLTLNLIQLRRLDGDDTPALRRYLLGLALIAALEPLDPFLRQGCLLVPDTDSTPQCSIVERDGTRTDVSFATDTVRSFADEAAAAFGVGPDAGYTFDKDRAKKDAKAKK